MEIVDTIRGRILLADDEEVVRNRLRRVLESAGYQVTLASNGRELLDAFQLDRYDVIVVDILMPGLSGDIALMQIRSINPDQRAIVISGHQVDISERNGGSNNVVYMQKPFESSELVTTVEEITGSY